MKNSKVMIKLKMIYEFTVYDLENVILHNIIFCYVDKY